MKLRNLSVGMWCALFLFAGSLIAQERSTNYALTVSPDRENALYHKGEKVVFKIRLTLDKAPVKEGEVEWTISKDGVAPSRSGKASLKDGEATLDGSLDEPGFLQCRATFNAAKKITAIAGAGVDPFEIKPSLPPPDDFDAFWAAQKKELAKIPFHPKLAPVDSPAKEVECFDVQIECEGAPVSGYLARPKGAAAHSLPIILTVHGAGVRSSILGGTADWAKRGFLAMDINAHGIPNGKPAQFYTDLANGELKGYPSRGRESRDTVYFRGMFLRLVRALDFLTAQPEWNGGPVVVHGSSQGGAQSIVAAGLDPRVTFFAAGVPAMCDHTGVVVGRVNGWPKLVPNGPDGKPDSKVLEAARYYDAMNFATRTKAAGILTVGFIDTTCPPTSVYAAYNALSAPKEIFNDPTSPHTVTPRAGEAMRKAILAHVRDYKNGR